MALQNPVTPLNTPVSWTYLQFNFAHALTNAGGTIPLVIDPNLSTLPTAPKTIAPTCTPPRGNISQESFALPDNLYNVVPGFFYRIIVSGSCDGSVSEEATVAADTKPPITLPPQYEPRVAGVNDPGYSLYRISPTPRNSDPSGRSRLKR